MDNSPFFSDNFTAINTAFLLGDAVKTTFFVKKSQLYLAEESYFFLMSSMRKLRMQIPLTYTLDFFQQLFLEKVIEKGISDAFIQFMVFRELGAACLQKSEVSFYCKVEPNQEVFGIQKSIEMDIIKEISVNTNVLSQIQVHCPENVFAKIYAQENDLDEVILLNPNKRIARSITGNLLFLENGIVKIPKHSEGAYISPLTESILTFIHKNNLAEILPSELIAFESQKSDEILMISDEKGIFSVQKIRNKTFANQKFSQWIDLWKNTF